MQIRLGHIFGVYHELIIGKFEHNRVAEYIAYYLSRKGHRIVSGFLAVPAVKVAEIVYVSKKQSALCALVGYLFAYLGNSVPRSGKSTVRRIVFLGDKVCLDTVLLGYILYPAHDLQHKAKFIGNA